jgi:hypothetical protein
MDNTSKRDPALDEIEKHFHQATLRERIRILATGLRAPRDSREYKLARVEAQRLAAPATAILLPLLLVAAAVIIAIKPKDVFHTGPIVNYEPEPVEEDHEWETFNPEPEDKTDTVQNDNQPDHHDPFETPLFNAPDPVAPVQSVERIEIPVTRTPPGTGNWPGDGKGPRRRIGPRPPAESEDAVMLGLRWLKLNQNVDGSWNANKPAMTGLALLCFLAHDELPGASAEFGETVQKAIQFLVASYNENTRSFAGADGNEYAHLIAAYALCEAYGMTEIPPVRVVAASATRRIIEGQQPSGGWDYKLAPGSERADTSYMGWAAQSLRAAQLSGVFKNDPEWSGKLDRACKRSNNGFLKNGAPGGGFGYTEPGRAGLTAVGVLCMHYHGAGRHRQVADSLKLMEAWKPGWAATAGDAARLGIGGSVQYYYYYATQAMYLQGGKPWRDWSDAMVGTYARAQKITKNAIAGPDGKMRDAGWWEDVDNHTDRPVMDTCLAILQLEVYYRGDRSFTLGLNAMRDLQTARDATDANDVKIETGTL